MESVTKTPKRKVDDEKESLGGEAAAEESSPPLPPKKKKQRPPTKCPSNAPLVQALHGLSEALFRAQSVDAQNRFKAVAIRRAANALAELEHDIVAGAPLATGPNKVPGVGKGTAAYIDEFLETGEIYETQKYNEMAEKQKMKQEPQLAEEQAPVKTKATRKKQAKKDDGSSSQAKEDGTSTSVKINRAPVLTLWVTIVAEQEGFSRDEALTFGQWVSGTLARSKGRSLGIFKEEEADKASTKEKYVSEHVVAFGHMKIPIVMKKGKRLAVQGRKTMDPLYVQDYLERSFGEHLEEVQGAMKDLAHSLSPEELKKQCYHLYEEFRPDWKGWGQKSLLHISKIRNLSKGKKN